MGAVRLVQTTAGFSCHISQTSSTLLIFILAMLLNPDVQARAQAEIDSIVGLARLPVFEDRPSLPYIEAVLRETLRWHPAVPLGKSPILYVSTFPNLPIDEASRTLRQVRTSMTVISFRKVRDSMAM